MARRQSHVPAERNPSGPFDPPPQQYGAFAVPALEEGAPYVDDPGNGWAPPVYRMPPGGSQQVYDYRADPAHPRDTYRYRDADDSRRHSVEDQDADGWQEQKGGSGKAIAPDPRRNPPPEDRLTMKMAPRSYSFTRPFDQLNRSYGDAQVGTARQLNGVHFSMADHRRTYDILGMAPAQRTRRNTYRLMPPPWDTNLVDLPPEMELPNARVRSVEIPPSGNRSYRLG